MKLMLGDRLGGVIFDIQQYRSFKRAGVPLPDHGNPVRQKWIEYCSEFLGIIEAMDEKELRESESNPRIGYCVCPAAVGVGTHCAACQLERRPHFVQCNCGNPQCTFIAELCTNSDHDRCGQRKLDCTECFPPTEQASLTSSLANLDEVPDSNPRIGTICTCTDPVCNSDNNYPKACYACGGIKVQP